MSSASSSLFTMMWTAVILALSGLSVLTQQAASCSPNYVPCDDGECVRDYLYNRCDHVTACSDASDEIGCYNCDSARDWTCSNGQCIYSSQRCDGDAECADGSDEVGCDSPVNIGLIIGASVTGVILLIVTPLIIGVLVFHCSARHRHRYTAVVIAQPAAPPITTTVIASQSSSSSRCVSTSTYQPMVAYTPARPIILT